MSREVDEVALYAILLREAASNHHTGPDSLLDDLSSCRGEVSFATLLAHQYFTDLDWDIVEILIDDPNRALRVAQDLFEYEEPLVAEALLHAKARRDKEPSAQWADPFRARRREVRRAIHAFEREGIATKFEDVDRLADDAYCAGTGASREELLERFYDPIWEAEAT